MVELRKRKAPAEAAPPPPTKKANSVKGAVKKVKDAVLGESTPTNGATSNGKSGKPSAGDTITIDGFGGEIETNDGEKTSLKQLLEESKSGVVLFTYPKASTPGCTNQACLFRDSYEPLTATGFSIYGLSTDSPKSNTTFKTKQNLPYTLLCDPSATLIAAIGMKKAPKSTTRGVFVVDKEGKVLAAEAGGPAATVEVVKKLVGGGKSAGAVAKAPATEASTDTAMTDAPAPVEEKTEESKAEEVTPALATATNGEVEKVPSAEDTAKAEVAADVADTAQKLDGEIPASAEAPSTEAAPAPAAS
ncbi:MAG: hypothetical protein MMC33_000954 [Icmadophila ericetorum]|nr:hypothetical protein [Icmadophila ericetorum]